MPTGKPEFPLARDSHGHSGFGNSLDAAGTLMSLDDNKKGEGMGTTGSLGIRSVADGIGILGSAACALHCLAAPVLLVAGTALPAPFLTDEGFHQTLLWAIFPASILAFGLGCWRHEDRWVLLLGTLGLFGLTLAAAALEFIGETGERWVTLASGGFLIAAHLRNFGRCRAEELKASA